MLIELTIFGSDSKGKIPVSPYLDNTFDFYTQQFKSLKEAFNEMSTSFVMSKAYVFPHTKRLLRRKKDMMPYKNDRAILLAIDIDEITTKVDYLKVLDYFKKEDYTVILGKSRRWNGEDIFNIKGLMVVDLKNEPKHIKNALSILQKDLGTHIKIDMSVGDTISYQAPMHRFDIIYTNERGTNILDDAKATLVEANNKTDKIAHSTTSLLANVIFSKDMTDLSLQIFNHLGFRMIQHKVNDNGSINFTHGSEVNSPGGYFWFSSNPFLMHHNNVEKTVNIFGYVKETKEGKEFLKELNKNEQKNRLLPNTLSDYTVESRYLESDETIQTMLDKFIASSSGVFKTTSAMGTGKSNIIGDCIEKAHKLYQRVLVISSRISVAIDFAEKYGMKIYLDPEELKPNESLVVQFDSLHRYDLTGFDIIILDEFMSILLHHRSNLTSNQNLNVGKFYVALNTKRVLIADAFLTGFEDTYLKGRAIQSLINSYRDDTNLYEYTNANNFIQNLINTTKNKNKGESVSCSFMSVNVLKVVEKELKANNLEVICLTSETPDITKEIIYEKFLDSKNDTWDAILYTPTLTVGVSNLNNVVHQFHYDTGNAGGVIDSLQMVKRSRNAKNIHYFLQERQFYKETNILALNASADLAIKYHYKNKDKTLLVDLDYATGEFSLSELGKYINSIESFNNILENNHANAFKILLAQQFSKTPIIIDSESSFNLKDKVKEVKDAIVADKIQMLHENADVEFNSQEIRELRAKSIEYTPEEKTKLMVAKVQERVQHDTPKEIMLKICEKSIEDNHYIDKVKKLKDSLEINTYSLRGQLSNLVSTEVQTLQDKTDIQFIEYCILLGTGFKLNKWYSKKHIVEIDQSIGYGAQFEKFAKNVGYTWRNNRLLLNEDMLKYTHYLKEH